MSKFFSEKFAALTPYTPGEQPRERKYIKLNTNESPFPPSPKAVEKAAEAAKRLQLYSDPTAAEVTKMVAQTYGVEPEEVLMVNGSDEILNFAFMAYCDDKTPAAFPEITYGFYPVFAQVNNVPYVKIPLKEDFSIDIRDYFGLNKTIFIANPNAPTGIALKKSEIEEIIGHNPNNVVVIDEAYVDFGAESCVDLIHKYDNLLVTQTFSKSRSMAGARLGYGIGNKNLIQDLNTIKYSTNPYNVNSLSMAAGIGMLSDPEYMQKNCQTVMENREYTMKELKRLGFTMTDSCANFIFVKHPKLDGGKLYETLKARGVLVRHFTADAICQYNRITIGSREDMEALIKEVETILEETK